MPKRGQSDERFVALPVAWPGFEAIFAHSKQVFDRHTHDAFAVGYIEFGGQRWRSGRGEVEARAGDLIMSNPGEVHDGSPLGDICRTWRMLHIDPAIIRHGVDQLGMWRTTDYEFGNPTVHDPRLVQVMARLFRSATSNGRDQLQADELLLVLIGKLGHARIPRGRSTSSRIQHARSRIDDDPAHIHTLADLAMECDLTQWQLLRSFAKETGFTPHAYQMQRRIELARRLIVDGASLAEASSRSGFADQSHMTRTFRRRYGFSPGVWAAQTRKRA